ncbi:hypothetical protein SAMD00019534_053380 [Acytostelium subglobosum LB1]|uniref:hypothetical protein n=1 Tax=Acytostelium subglobosum LB1 TaxID=1410327 RepID=UPI000644B988|nr:hypothetical protein SAMD00019534_053380 [Acytostelium subglobosum LB1]GAM22163.1 hypothetical protein SAMD00019534_053380 [Acytostelium subglobosum LB1]|eukprot:XP_012755263.1 hypothetical protein SAMD00019534_053380 [Acytostelium subglobosum LB1]
MDKKKNMEMVGAVYELVSGFTRTKALNAAASLNIAQHIGENEKKSVNDIAKEIGANSQSLYRLMRALTHMKCFREEDVDEHQQHDQQQHGIFSHTPLSLALRQPEVRNIALMRGGYGQTQGWQNLVETIKTGQSDVNKTLGYPDYWAFLEEHTDEAAIFNNSLASVTNMLTPTLVSLGDYTKFETVVDLGGGLGKLLKGVLKQNANIKNGINFDIPSVIEKNQHEVDVDPRYKDQAGDFFVEVPAADCYVLKSILHDWSDAKCLEIFKTISKSIKPGGKVYVYDYINSLYTKNEKNFTPWNDLHMMVMLNGKERNEWDWQYLAEHSGFKIESVKRPEGQGFAPPLTIFTKQ